MEKLFGLCVLLVALSLAVTEDTYFKEGDSITLDVRPSYPDPITNILWKSRGDLLAEWIKDKVPVEVYRTLDTENGGLVVNNMSQADTGEDPVEINRIKSVPKPEVRMISWPCSPTSSSSCYVFCNGDTFEAEPVTYSWKIGDKDWEVLGEYIHIYAIGNGHDKFITCRMTNPLSEKVSEPMINPLYRGDEMDTSVVVGIVPGVIGVGVWAMWKFKKGPFKNRRTPARFLV